MEFTAQTDEDQYRIVGPGGEEGSVVPYGHTSVVTVGNDIYYATIVDEDAESVTVYKIDEVTEACEAETEDVEFSDSGAGIAIVDADES